MGQTKFMQFSVDLGGKTMTFETGSVAQFANGAVMTKMGGTVVLSAAVASTKPKEGASFFPLTIDYRERTYAMGKIPGGFFKREGRPREGEILACRLTDRSLRPLFPKGFANEVMVQNMVLSSDGENDADVLSIVGSSCALAISDIPFDGPVGAVRVARIGSNFIVNPTFNELQGSDLDIVISGRSGSIVMVEGKATILSEDVILAAVNFGLTEIGKLTDLQNEMRSKIGKPKFNFEKLSCDEKLKAEVDSFAGAKLREIIAKNLPKDLLDKEVRALGDQAKEALKEKFKDALPQVSGIVHDIFDAEARKRLEKDGIRLDGRKPDDIRHITCEIGVLPRTHGSAIFTRGQTQALATVTLGTSRDMQRMEELEGDYKERFLFHYNFPGFSVGEPRAERGPGRREIGHGHLARKGLAPLLPKEEAFPYTIRVVSDILSSNGSTSMASTCGGSLALYDAGVPVSDHVGGIAMGLIMRDNGAPIILTDIMGAEDHFGDMDFKVAGTRSGVTAIQMDVKVPGVTVEIIQSALENARLGRLTILDKMIQAISAPRNSLSIYAPKIVMVMIPAEKIGALIGPGGKNIRKIMEDTETEIEVDDDGRVFISGKDDTSVDHAKRIVGSLTMEFEIGKIYQGRVVSILDFGVFVELAPGREGLLHISEISNKRLRHASEALSVGEEIEVKVIDMDNSGKVRLSRRAVLYPSDEKETSSASSSSSPHRGFGLKPNYRDKDRRPPPQGRRPPPRQHR
ncbi:polyribonucleotide nucleotidyltransferase [Elusimicrobiota bacterium]